MKDLIGGLPDMLIFFILYGFLTFGIYITFKLLNLLISKNLINNNSVLWFICLMFNALNFYIIYDLMTVSPQRISGNGNPHIPYIFVSLLLFLSFCFVISMKIYDILLKKNRLINFLIVSTALFLCYLSMMFQSDFVSMIRGRLYYPMGSWLNWWQDIHLNYLYFNPYTFLFGNSISCLIAGILAFIKQGKYRAKQPEQ
ncbi:hypothetical protein [Peribacillus sp. SCS-155]|uniref:hypothetical protein n=1 Tax=Peribacillus sedimenti TaxID=3115297 RepID=UPI003905D773